MRALFGTLLLVTALLAGCSGDGGGGDGNDATGTSTSTGSSSQSKSSTSTKSQTSTSSSSQTGTGAPGNRAPIGGIAATVNGTTVGFVLTGSDADGDDLEWTLAFGDGSASQEGSQLPANATHTYVAGNYTARYNVTDGLATASYNVTVSVQAGLPTVALSFSSDVANYCSFCTEVLGEQDGTEPASPFPSVSWSSGEQGIDAVWVEVPAALIGHAWSATTTGADVAIAAFTACSPEGHFIEMVDTGANPETGIVPTGAGCMVLWEYLSWIPPPLGAPSDPAGGEQTLALTIS